MNKYIIFTLLFLSISSYSQQALILRAFDKNEQKTLDSIYANKTKLNLKQIENQAKIIEEKLLKLGFLSSKITPKKSNDSIFEYEVILGKRQTYLYLKVSENLQKELFLSQLEKVKISLIEEYIKKLQLKYDALGFSFHQISLKNFDVFNNELMAELYVNKENKRLLNHIVWQGMEKFPKNHQKFIEKKYIQKPFSQDLVKQIENEIKSFNFCQLSKSPELLFSIDSTKIYFSIEKKKNNQFDGYVGFSSNENNSFRLNGHLDLSLANLLGNGEQINIFWRNNGEEQTQFQAKLALPYLFGSKFTTQFDLNILQQDSTFQNTHTKIHLGYHLKKSQRIFLGYETISSNNISSIQNNLINDFNSNFVLLTFTNYPLFINTFNRDEDLLINVEFGYGKRDEKNLNQTQLRFKMFTEKNITINQKQNFWLRNENYYLLSDKYLINELYRFGGHQSFRGYLETNLQANQYHSLLTEYQYFFNPSFYLHSITDYGYYQDKTINFDTQMLTAGLGFGFASKNGIIKFSYVNPLVGQQGFKFSNSIVHLQFKSVF